MTFTTKTRANALSRIRLRHSEPPPNGPRRCRAEGAGVPLALPECSKMRRSDDR